MTPAHLADKLERNLPARPLILKRKDEVVVSVTDLEAAIKMLRSIT